MLFLAPAEHLCEQAVYPRKLRQQLRACEECGWHPRQTHRHARWCEVRHRGSAVSTAVTVLHCLAFLLTQCGLINSCWWLWPVVKGILCKMNKSEADPVTAWCVPTLWQVGGCSCAVTVCICGILACLHNDWKCLTLNTIHTCFEMCCGI